MILKKEEIKRLFIPRNSFFFCFISFSFLYSIANKKTEREKSFVGTTKENEEKKCHVSVFSRRRSVTVGKNKPLA